MPYVPLLMRDCIALSCRRQKMSQLSGRRSYYRRESGLGRWNSSAFLCTVQVGAMNTQCSRRSIASAQVKLCCCSCAVGVFYPQKNDIRVKEVQVPASELKDDSSSEVYNSVAPHVNSSAARALGDQGETPGNRPAMGDSASGEEPSAKYTPRAGFQDDVFGCQRAAGTCATGARFCRERVSDDGSPRIEECGSCQPQVIDSKSLIEDSLDRSWYGPFTESAVTPPVAPWWRLNHRACGGTPQ